MLKFSLLVIGWASFNCLRYEMSLMLVLTLSWIGMAIFGTISTWIGIFPDDSVSILMVATSRFLFVDVLAPNAERLIDSFLVGWRPSFVASDCAINERWAPSSNSRLASARVVAELTVDLTGWVLMLWELSPLFAHFRLYRYSCCVYDCSSYIGSWNDTGRRPCDVRDS